MQEGDVVLTPVPQADGTMKNRPAIVLREMPVYLDVLVCGVSTQLHQYVPGFDELISPADGRFCCEWTRGAVAHQAGLSCRHPSEKHPRDDRCNCARTAQALITGPEQLSAAQSWVIGRS